MRAVLKERGLRVSALSLVRRRGKVARVNDLYFTSGLVIRKLESSELRLYSRKKDAATGKRMNLGRFDSLEKAVRYDREVQFCKRQPPARFGRRAGPGNILGAKLGSETARSRQVAGSWSGRCGRPPKSRARKRTVLPERLTGSRNLLSQDRLRPTGGCRAALLRWSAIAGRIGGGGDQNR